MPAADPMSRGPRRRFRKLQDNAALPPTKQAVIADLVECDELISLLTDLMDEGHALTIGRTRDGGALVLGFLMGGKPIKRYIVSREQWLELLDEMQD